MRKLFALSFCILSLLQINAFAARSTVAKQEVSTAGTKVTESGVNSLVDAECTDSYFGCMDAFCMVENVSGGRCQCSNKHIDLSKQLNDLLKKQEDADNIAKYGSDFVKTANVESDITNITKNATKKTIKPEQTETKKSLSRADWDAMFAQNNDDDEDEESETTEFVDNDDISNKHGDELYVAADEMCFEQTPSKCKSNGDMLKLMYAQKIKSDCAAFENTVKKQSGEINAKLIDAQNAVRDAALSELSNSNKYGLGQCVREFKICMQTTAGCGSDFGGCVLLSANENVSGDVKNVSIGGDILETLISASTMDNLISKKVLCESVLNNCVAVKDNVWDAFIRDVAPVIRTAELNAEDDLRSNCIKSVSDCYVKSCHEHFDVNQEDGSYDMCLSRPENYKSFCKIELEPCLNATGGSFEEPSKSRLWQGIISQLGALRVNACTDEFKACIQDEDRCGKDYSKCIGLDENDVAMLCPDDKLTACYKEYEGNKETVRETLANVANVVMMQVHSGLSDACENAVKEAMVKLCDDPDNCNNFIIGDKVGSRTLELKFCEVNDGDDMYTNCKDTVSGISDIEIGKTARNSDLSKTANKRHVYTGVILGRIMWDQITPLPDYSGVISGEEYIKKVESLSYMDDKTKDKVKTEVGAITNAIKNAISTIESDPRVQFCMTGRQVAGLTGKDGLQQYIGKEGNATFPNITQSARVKIIDGALLSAQKYYNEKYDSLIAEDIDGTFQLEKRYAEIDNANFHLKEQDSARMKCISLGERAAFSNTIQKNDLAKNKIVRESSSDDSLIGHSAESTYNFKRQVTTSFNMDSMICTKCTRTQECELTKSDHCKKWGKEKETCEEIQY